VKKTLECGCTPALLACICDHWEVALYLLANGASAKGVSCHKCSDTYRNGFCRADYSLLHHAALQEGDKYLVVIMGKYQVSISNTGVQPVHLAAGYGNLAGLELLFEKTDNPKALLESKVAGISEADRRDCSRKEVIPGGSSLHYAARNDEI